MFYQCSCITRFDTALLIVLNNQWGCHCRRSARSVIGYALSFGHEMLLEVENLIEQENHPNDTAMDNVQYIHLAPGASLHILPTIRPFSAVVIISAEVTSEWRHMVSEWLVEQGCLCMMAWGIDCSLWDDSVDIANLEAHDWEDIPDSQFVMTTWHEKEPLSDVLWSAHFSIFDPPDSEIDHLVILDVTTEPREPAMRELYVKSCSKVEQ